MYKLDFKKGEEPEIKLPTFVGSQRNQGNSRKTSVSASLTMLKPLTVWITLTNWGSSLRYENTRPLTCLLRNLYTGHKATVRIRHGTTDWFEIGKGVQHGCILSPCLFNFYAKYLVSKARLGGPQAGIKTAGEISITSDMQMIPL